MSKKQQLPASAPTGVTILADFGLDTLQPAIWNREAGCWKVFAWGDVKEMPDSLLKDWLPIPDMDQPIASISEAVTVTRISSGDKYPLLQAKKDADVGAMRGGMNAAKGNRRLAAQTLGISLGGFHHKVDALGLQRLIVRQPRTKKEGK